MPTLKKMFASLLYRNHLEKIFFHQVLYQYQHTTWPCQENHLPFCKLLS